MESVLSTLTITKTICDTISGIRNGPDLVRKTAESVLQFHGLLERIQQLHAHANQPFDSTSIEYAGLANAVKASAADVHDFAGKLQSLQLTHGQKVAGRVWTRLKTVVSEKDLEVITAKISRHNGNISTHLEVINSKITMDVKSMTADASSAIGRIEHASVLHTETASQYHEEIKSRLDAHTELLTQSASVSNSQAGAVQDTLAQILQLLQQKNISLAQTREASGILGEIVEDGDEPLRERTPSHSDAVDSLDEHLVRSIERLGRLVREKERTYDTFDSDDDHCAAIIEDLGNILTDAKKKSRDLADNVEELDYGRRYGRLARSITHFNKVHGSNTMTINPRDQAAYRQKKRRRQTDIIGRDLSCEMVPLSSGTLILKKRKVFLKCKCSESACVHRHPRHSTLDVRNTEELPMECLTTVTFTPHGQQNPYILIASEYNLRNRAIGNLKSISYLAVNPVLPQTSRVFEVVESGDLQELRKMLQKGEASLRDTDENGLSLLFYAAQQPTIMKYLLRHGLDVDHIGYKFGEVLLTALQYAWDDSEMDCCELSRSHECRELLLAAGADPLASFPRGTHSFLLTQAFEPEGRAAEYVKRAVSEGSISLRDVIEHTSDELGRNMLHVACENYELGSTKDNISAILDLGFDINATDNDGITCLGIYSNSLGHWSGEGPASAIREQEVLVFLLQSGADPHAVIEHGISIVKGIYECHDSFRRIYRRYKRGPQGSYCGDLWDSALSICGMDILEFRAGYQRRAEYNWAYTRRMFEALWRGRETACPYWDDEPWPPVATGDTNDGCQCSDCTGNADATLFSCQKCMDMGEAQSEGKYSVDGESHMDSESHEFDEGSDEEDTGGVGVDEYSDLDED